MFTVVHLIPTGVGATIGGFAGDATPVAHLLASVCDRLVTHPNALNAANLFSKPANAFYVEGGMLDQWLAGGWALRPRRANRIGLLVDKAVEAMPEGTLEGVINAANAVRAVYGVDVIGYHVTAKPLGCAIRMGAGGTSSGEVAEPQALVDAAVHLLSKGATAIAVLADLGELPPEREAEYQSGRGVDPIGGLEAILSHLVVRELGVPAAHAPIFPFEAAPPPVVDPRAAAEYLGHNYLPCILQGLSAHPELVAAEEAREGDLIHDAIAAVVLPAGCLGGPGALAAHALGIPLIAVRENETVSRVTAEALGLSRGVIEVGGYLEAAGVLAAMRAGIDWRACTRPLPALQAL